MIRVAFVINSIHIGGPSYVIRNIIRNMNHEMFEFYLVTLFDNENSPEVIEELRNQNVRVIKAHFFGRINALLNKQKIFNKIISDNGIQVIHSHGFIPDILSARCNENRVNKVSTLHNNLFFEYPEVYGEIMGRCIIPIHIYFLKKLHFCACCSQFVFDSMKEVLPNLTVIRNGIDRTKPKHSVTREEIGVPDDAILFIYVGQLRKRKNIIWLIQQFISFHNNKEYLIILGKGPDKDACEKFQERNIIHYGFSNDPYAFMKISDVYISAALAEGFSISVLEAMDNGLVLFLSDIPAHTEVFKAAKRVFIGEFFKSNDINDFGKKFDLLRKKLSKIDRQAIKQIKEQELSAKQMTEKYENIYTMY